MRERIELTGGGFALVDPEDYEQISRYKWQHHIHGGACRSPHTRASTRGTVGQTIFMHRVILGLDRGDPIDFRTRVKHINGDKLDNRKANLAIGTLGEMLATAKKRGVRADKQPTSEYRGVARQGNGWKAQITAKGVYYYLGWFTEEERAAEAYDEAALEHFGRFATLNFPEDRRWK